MPTHLLSCFLVQKVCYDMSLVQQPAEAKVCKHSMKGKDCCISRTLRDSQRWKQQPQSPHVSAPDPLHICGGYLAWGFYWTPNNGRRCFSDSLVCPWDLISSYWVA